MESARAVASDVAVRARNVGGIDETVVTLEPGVNVLTGRNASNRTSFLQAIMAALGSDRASLKGDADEGRVELEVDDVTYTRTMERVDGRVDFGGEPWTDDPANADLFAFLLESNEARQAVERGDDLRELIMRPVDTDAIRAEIESLEARRRELESALADRDRLADERGALEDRRDRLEEELAAKRSALEEQEAAIDAASAELEASRELKADLEAKLEELRDHRSTRESLRTQVQTERATAEELREERREVVAELEAHEEVDGADAAALESRREELRERKRRLDTRINQLQSLVEFNEDVLAGGDGPVEVPGSDDGVGSVTDQLLPEGATVRCWTCGSETSLAHVEETLEELRERRTELVGARSEVDAELESVVDQLDAIAEREQHREELARRRDDLESELDDVETAVASLEERREEVAEAVERVEDEVEELREAEHEELIELHADANALALAVEQLEGELDEVERSLASTVDRMEELASLEEERAAVADRLEAARTRIERVEDEAIETFNDQMEQVLAVLGYENLERIWIERTEREGRGGGGTERRGSFDLHVVRTTDDGAVYEDTVDHLSESEREVTGLVFALAGYLAHDLHESMPFVLLDSIEAIDSDRIGALVDYLEEYAPYLVVALLPEDAAAVSPGYNEITEI
jgi:DNA repair exonuclease SbcCD ATPase subunit